MSNVRLTKAGLLEAIKDYPDDAPVVVDGGFSFDPLIKEGTLLGFDGHNAVVWAVSSDPAVIKLEL